MLAAAKLAARSDVENLLLGGTNLFSECSFLLHQCLYPAFLALVGK